MNLYALFSDDGKLIELADRACINDVLWISFLAKGHRSLKWKMESIYVGF